MPFSAKWLCIKYKRKSVFSYKGEETEWEGEWEWGWNIAPGVADTPQCSEAKRGVVAKHGKTAEESSGDALQKN